jgi:chromate transporter
MLETQELVEEELADERAEQEEVLYTPPHLSYWKLFLLFLGFGVRSWGGPTAQIALLQQELVTEQRWISPEKFSRIYGIYQILPGPEATELCCYFGLVARGRIGSVIGGLGFVLPGLLCMLLLSVSVGSLKELAHFKAAIDGVTPAISGLVFRGTHKIAEAILLSHNTNSKNFENFESRSMLCVAAIAAILSSIRMNYFIVLFITAAMGPPMFLSKIHKPIVRIALCSIPMILLIIGLSIYYAIFNSLPNEEVIRIVGDNSYLDLFIVGLLAGLLTFGGAYTAIPFIFSAVVVSGQWCSENDFLTALALGSIIPAPLVMFVLYIGYVGRGVLGGLLMTLGMFIPAFSFTLVFHQVIEKLLNFKVVLAVADSLSAGIVGILTVTAFDIANRALINNYSALILLLTIGASYHFNHRFLTPLIVLIAALAGFVTV